MSFSQKEYIKEFNKNNYHMFQFRVRNDKKDVIDYLLNMKGRNEYINSLIDEDIHPLVYTIKELKQIIKPILHKYGITEIYLFGSYARGEARKDSDIDIYCNKGNIKTLIDQGMLEEELEEKLNKKIDIVFIGSEMGDSFKNAIMEDLIQLC